MNNIPAATTANKKLDDDAFMKYDTSKEVGAFSTGCGALKEVYLEQAKRKVSFYEKELTRVQRYVCIMKISGNDMNQFHNFYFMFSIYF